MPGVAVEVEPTVEVEAERTIFDRLFALPAVSFELARREIVLALRSQVALAFVGIFIGTAFVALVFIFGSIAVHLFPPLKDVVPIGVGVMLVAFALAIAIAGPLATYSIVARGKRPTPRLAFEAALLQVPKLTAVFVPFVGALPVAVWVGDRRDNVALAIGLLVLVAVAFLSTGLRVIARIGVGKGSLEALAREKQKGAVVLQIAAGLGSVVPVVAATASAFRPLERGNEGIQLFTFLVAVVVSLHLFPLLVVAARVVACDEDAKLLEPRE